MKRDLLLIAISMFAWGLGEGMFLYFQPIYLEQLGADPVAIGSILGGFGLAMTISHIPAGYLADRFGRKPLLVAAWVLGTLATWTMAFAGTLAVFVAGLLLYGITLFVMSPLQSYVAAARGKLSVGRAITLISAGFNLGAVIGPWLGGRIGDQLGIRQTYFIAGSIFIASTFILLFIRPQPVEGKTASGRDRGWISSPRYMVYMGVIFVAIFATYLPQPLTPNYLSNQGGLNLSQVGSLYSVASVGVVVLNLVLGALPARIGFLLGQAAVGIFSLLLWSGTGLAWYLPAFLLLGGFRTAKALGMAQVRELAPSERMGLAFGLSETVAAAAVVLAPLLAGYLYSLNPRAMYPLAGSLILISLVVSAVFSPARKQPEEGPAGTVPVGIEIDQGS